MASRQTSISLEYDIYDSLVKKAKKEDRSLNYLINKILKDYFGDKN